jgi:iron complex outermembrane receptor protein
MKTSRGLIFASVAAIALAVGSAAPAQSSGERDYDIAAQDLKYSLRELAKQDGLQLVAPSDLLNGRKAPALHGHYSTAQALELLLKGSDISAEIRDGAIIIGGRNGAPPLAANHDVAGGGSEIVVTGSRIRGAPIASPVIVVGQADMLNSGRATLAEAIKEIPQNFGGGVNLGVGVGVPEDNGTNLAGGSSINLRGLGSDATLTLLNGHRLAYNVNKQAVDISSIPLAAVDRIEIVADGASALYGSDAVGGVANILLKKDFQGLSLSMRQAASTSGGNRQQQYGAVTGSVWDSGGFMVAYDFERDLPILGRQRSYAADRPALTLLPYARHHSVVLSGHQDLASSLSFTVDGLYNNRRTHRSYALTADADYRVTGARNFASSTSFAVAPSLIWSPGDGVELSLTGLYGEDRSHYGSAEYLDREITFQTRGCYCNKAQSIELSGQAPLFALPGGDLKVAFGGGYRNNDFHGFRTVGAAQSIRVAQDSYYGFAEFDLPIVGPDNAMAGIDRLNLSAALRYEDYPGIDKVATPKLGLIYAPTPDFDLKGSWGKSFKAPTLYQRFNAKSASILPASILGADGAPDSAAAIILTGGNADLKPERATTWTVTLAAHPTALPGFKAELGYFNIRYRDRIVSPITFLTQALSNPIYSDLVNVTPSDVDTATALEGAQIFNYMDGVYDIYAIIADNSRNVASQNLHGVDGSIRYRLDLEGGDSLTFSGSATYLKSNQKLSPLQPTISLAGTIFNPPHVRAVGGIVWTTGPLTNALNVNYTGSVRDVRSTSSFQIGSMTTADLTVRYAFDSAGGLTNGLALGLSVQNMFNDKPGLIRTTQLFQSPYDSTNYSPFGRFISFTVTKAW